MVSIWLVVSRFGSIRVLASMAWRPVPEDPSRVLALFKGVPAGSARRGFAELENRQRRKSFVGSNPTPSALFSREKPLCLPERSDSIRRCKRPADEISAWNCCPAPCLVGGSSCGNRPQCGIVEGLREERFGKTGRSLYCRQWGFEVTSQACLHHAMHCMDKLGQLESHEYPESQAWIRAHWALTS